MGGANEITHVVFTLSQWGQLRLQIQQLPHEYLFLQEHLPLMIEHRDVHLVGEFVQCLRIFGVEESNSSVLDGIHFLLEEQMEDGSWDNGMVSGCNGEGVVNGCGDGVANGCDGSSIIVERSSTNEDSPVSDLHNNSSPRDIHSNPSVHDTHTNSSQNTHTAPNNSHNTSTLNVDEAYVAYHATMVAVQALIPPLFTGYGCMSESTEAIVSQWYQTEVWESLHLRGSFYNASRFLRPFRRRIWKTTT